MFFCVNFYLKKKSNMPSPSSQGSQRTNSMKRCKEQILLAHATSLLHRGTDCPGLFVNLPEDIGA